MIRIIGVATSVSGSRGERSEGGSCGLEGQCVGSGGWRRRSGVEYGDGEGGGEFAAEDAGELEVGGWW